MTIGVNYWLFSKKIEWSNKNQGYEKREEAYLTFINTTFKIIQESKIEDKSIEKGDYDNRLISMLEDFRVNVVLFSTVEVMNAWKKAKIIGGRGNNFENLEVIENLIIAMRKELGVPSKKIKSGDILELLLDHESYNNFMKYVKNKNSKPNL